MDPEDIMWHNVDIKFSRFSCLVVTESWCLVCMQKSNKPHRCLLCNTSSFQLYKTWSLSHTCLMIKAIARLRYTTLTERMPIARILSQIQILDSKLLIIYEQLFWTSFFIRNVLISLLNCFWNRTLFETGISFTCHQDTFNSMNPLFLTTCSGCKLQYA